MSFRLPEFIENTGISRMRDQCHDSHKSLKQKMRERMQPRMGKIDIDYQVLHDAFFKFQTKPKLTVHGDTYFEGKEYEIRMRDYKPGRISPELRAALGIPDNAPPPWLQNMTRYGPPPAYPNLKVPGVNAPVQDTAFGLGKLFTDERGFTIYGDCFGLNRQIYEKRAILRQKWGELKEEDDDDDELDDDLLEDDEISDFEEDEEGEEVDSGGIQSVS